MALGRVGVRFAVGVVCSESAEQEKTNALIWMGQQRVCRAHGC